MNEDGSERGRALAVMRARRVALSGTSNRFDLLVIEKVRGVDQSLLPTGRTRQLYLPRARALLGKYQLRSLVNLLGAPPLGVSSSS